MTYKTKAKKLSNCGFFVYGSGNFDLTIEETAYLLGLIEKGDFREIKKLYKILLNRME